MMATMMLSDELWAQFVVLPDIKDILGIYKYNENDSDLYVYCESLALEILFYFANLHFKYGQIGVSKKLLLLIRLNSKLIQYICYRNK